MYIVPCAKLSKNMSYTWIHVQGLKCGNTDSSVRQEFPCQNMCLLLV